MNFGPDVVAASADGESPSWYITRHPVSFNNSETGLKFRVSVQGIHEIGETKSEKAAYKRLAAMLKNLEDVCTNSGQSSFSVL